MRIKTLLLSAVATLTIAIFIVAYGCVNSFLAFDYGMFSLCLILMAIDCIFLGWSITELVYCIRAEKLAKKMANDCAEIIAKLIEENKPFKEFEKKDDGKEKDIHGC